eukprot:UN10647
MLLSRTNAASRHKRQYTVVSQTQSKRRSINNNISSSPLVSSTPRVYNNRNIYSTNNDSNNNNNNIDTTPKLNDNIINTSTKYNTQ